MGFGKDGRGVIIRESTGLISIGALTALGVFTFGGLTTKEDLRILKSEVVAGMTGGDAGEGEGVILGIANGGLSSTNIKECLEANGPLDTNDRVRQEKAERQAHTIGVSHKQAAAAVELPFRDKISNALVCIDRFPWTYADPDAWNFFLYNTGPAIATGSNVYLTATHYGVWVI